MVRQHSLNRRLEEDLADPFFSQDHSVRNHGGRPYRGFRLGRSAAFLLAPSISWRHDFKGVHSIRALPHWHDRNGDPALWSSDQGVQGPDFERTECRHVDVAVAEDDMRGLVRRVRVLGRRHGF